METKVLLKPPETEFTAHMSEAFSIMASFPKDIIIVSAENQQMNVNRMLLSIYSPTMTSLLLSSSTIILPDCSSKSIKILISIITRGFTTNECSSTFDIDDILEVVETGKILGIKVKNLKADLICNESSDKSKDKNVNEGTNKEAVIIDTIADKNNFNENVTVYKQMALNQNYIYNDEIKERSENLEAEVLSEKDITNIKDDVEESMLSVSLLPDQNVDNLEELMKDVDNMINNSVSIPNKIKSNKNQFIVESEACETEIISDHVQDNIESMDLNNQYSDLTELTDQYVDNLEEMMLDVDNMINNSLNIPTKSKSSINEIIDATDACETRIRRDNNHDNIERMDPNNSKDIDLVKVQNIISPHKTIDSPIDFEKEIEKIRSNILNITEESQEFCNTISDVIPDDGYPINKFSIHVSDDKSNEILEYSDNLNVEEDLDSVTEILTHENNVRNGKNTMENFHFIDHKIEERNTGIPCEKVDANYVDTDVINDIGYPIDKFSKNISTDKPSKFLEYSGNINGEEDLDCAISDPVPEILINENNVTIGKITKKKFIDDRIEESNTETEKSDQKENSNKYGDTDIIPDDGYPIDKFSKNISGDRPDTIVEYSDKLNMEEGLNSDITDLLPEILTNKNNVKFDEKETSVEKNSPKNGKEGDTNKYVGVVTSDFELANGNAKKIIVDCQICGKHFNLKIAIANVAMEYHYAIHHFKEDLLAFTDGTKCILCEKMFARIDNALVHVGVFHGKLDLLLSGKGLRKLRKSQFSAKEKSSINIGSGNAFDNNKHHTKRNELIMEETYNLDKNPQESVNVDIGDSALQMFNKTRDTICENKKIEVINPTNISLKEGTNENVNTPNVNVELVNGITEKISNQCQICNKHFSSHFNLEYHYVMLHFKKDISMLKGFITKDKCIPCDKTFTRYDYALTHVGGFHNKLDILLSNKGLKQLRKIKRSSEGKLSTNDEFESEGYKPADAQNIQTVFQNDNALGATTDIHSNNYHKVKTITVDSDIVAGEDNSNIDSQEVFKHHTNETKTISEDPYNFDKDLNLTSKKSLQESLNFELRDPKVTNAKNSQRDENVNTASETVELTNGITEKIGNQCQICYKHFNPKTGSAKISLQYHYAIHHFRKDLSVDIFNGEKCILCDKTFSKWDNALVHVGGFHNKLDILLSNKGLKKLRKSKWSDKGKLSTNDKSENHSEIEGDKPADTQNIQAVFQNDNATTNIHINSDFKVKTIIVDSDIIPEKDDDNINSQKVFKHQTITHAENMGQKESINNGVDCQICNKHFRRQTNLEYHYAMFHFKEDLLMLKDFISEKKCIPCDKIFTRKYVVIMHVGIYHEQINLLLSNKGLKKLKQSKLSTKKLEKKHIKRQKMGDISTKKRGKFPKEQIALKSLQEILNFELSDPKVTNAVNMSQREGINNGIQCQICNKHFRKDTHLEYHYAMFHFKEDLLMLKDFISEKKCIPCDKIFARKPVVIMHVGLYHEQINLLLSNKGLRKLKNIKRRKRSDKSKKKKGKFSKEQITFLTAEFDKCEIMTNSMCTSLANKTGLKTKQIRNLFKIKKAMRRPKITNLDKISNPIQYTKNQTSLVEIDKAEILNESSYASLDNSSGFKRKQTRQSVKNEENKRKYTLPITAHSIESKKSVDELFTGKVYTDLDKSVTLDGSIANENFNEQKITIKDMTPEQKGAYHKQRSQIRNEKYGMSTEVNDLVSKRDSEEKKNSMKAHEGEVSENLNKQKIKIKDMTPEQKREYQRRANKKYQKSLRKQRDSEKKKETSMMSPEKAGEGPFLVRLVNGRFPK